MEESNLIVEEESNKRALSRKEKKKLAKKKKRKEKRKEVAVKEREAEEAMADDSEDQRKLEMMIKEAEEERERALKVFEERERIWIQEMELKKKKEEEEEEEEAAAERMKVLEEREKEEENNKQLQVEKENECDEGDNWEYVEEGPAEIIWQGNEITIRKKKVRVPKKNANQLSGKEDVDRPTSNSLPPQSEAFADYQTAQQALENVAKQVPNFGTEQDKAHCPFHLKTGACRFGQRCSRVHFYPDKSCTLLVKNMYNGPGLAWEQDEGLEYTDEEVECSYEEFYEDVHTEFLKFGEIVNFKVCRNGSPHLRGNVYVHYKSLESAVVAYHSVNGRYFAGKQVTCEFINVTRWKVAICGEFMKSRLKTCSRGMACNFIHCFRNPGGDYEWADWDKPPPRYWVKKMAALFGYSDESCFSKEMEQDHAGRMRNSNKIDSLDADRRWSKRSRSREIDLGKSGTGRRYDYEPHVWEGTCSRKHTSDDRKQIKPLDEKICEESIEFNDSHHSESRSDKTNSDGSWSDGDKDKERERRHGHTRKHIRHRIGISEKSTDYMDTEDKTPKADYDGKLLEMERDAETYHVHTRNSPRYRSRGERVGDNGDKEKKTHVAYRDWQDRDRYGERDHRHLGKRSTSPVRYKDKHDNYERDHSGSIKDWSDGDISTDGHWSHKRRSSGCQSNGSKYLDEDEVGKYRSYYTDSGDDWLDRDKERHNRHRRKCLRHQTEESEFSDDQVGPTKKSKKNLHNRESESEKSDTRRDTRHKRSSRSHLSKGKSRKQYRRSKSKGGDNESSSSGQCDERCKSIDEQDCWKSINAEEG